MLSCVTSNWGDYSPHPVSEEVNLQHLCWATLVPLPAYLAHLFLAIAVSTSARTSLVLTSVDQGSAIYPMGWSLANRVSNLGRNAPFLCCILHRFSEVLMGYSLCCSPWGPVEEGPSPTAPCWFSFLPCHTLPCPRFSSLGSWPIQTLHTSPHPRFCSLRVQSRREIKGKVGFLLWCYKQL